MESFVSFLLLSAMGGYAMRFMGEYNRKDQQICFFCKHFNLKPFFVTFLPITEPSDVGLLKECSLLKMCRANA